MAGLELLSSDLQLETVVYETVLQFRTIHSVILCNVRTTILLVIYSLPFSGPALCEAKCLMDRTDGNGPGLLCLNSIAINYLRL